MDNIAVTHTKFFLAIFCTSIISGCGDNQNAQEPPSRQNNKDLYYIEEVNFSYDTDKDVDKSVKPQSTIVTTQPVQPVSKAGINANAVEKARMVQEGLSNTYARKAANLRDMCPKLLVKDVDSNKIARHGELLKDNYCDYYLYPFPEDRINVLSNGTALNRYLIAPTQHNFADGSYLVETADKYVIRVKTTKTQRKPVNYDIVVTIDNDANDMQEGNKADINL